MTDPVSPTLFAFALTSLLIELTPGPNMGYLAALSLMRGRTAGFAAVAGITLGLSIYGIAAALGVSAVIAQSVWLYEGLRWAGVAYLLWLAWEGWSAEQKADPALRDDEALGAFRRGLITNLLNPKAALFYIAVVPAFIPAQANDVRYTLLLTAIYVGVATAVHSLLVLMAGRLQTAIATPERRRPARRILSILIACLAVWFAVSTARL